MIEDDGYRASSQYRYWSFTRQKLAETRHNTNALATAKVKAAFQRTRASYNGEDSTDQSSHTEINTLTVTEELDIVEWGGSKIVQMGEAMEPRIPSHIVATAILYLPRFSLTNTPMTYHPKQIIACALFLATKADHFYIPLHKFVMSLDNGQEADVKAPEFLLMQGLRFTLDVRHPMRALEGGVAEIQALANEGHLGVLDRQVDGKKQTASHRIGSAADKAKGLLVTAAQMTDAYFLYTPAQIWLASLLVNDRQLTLAYIDCVIRRLGEAGSLIKDKLKSTVMECAQLLGSWVSPDQNPARAKEIRRAGRKLTACQNPEKVDIVELARLKAAEKRDGSESDVERVLKKRKLEREKLQKDGEVFGPDLKSLE